LFEADYNEIKLQNIIVTSFQLRHHHYVTEKRHQSNFTNIFSNLSPSQSKFLVKISGCASGLGLIIWWSLKKAVLVLKKIGGLGLVI